ncbi:sensor histidine kinase [uncultured Roseobacter sp.]|uniref:sensor histidine kinase n=1 Tax=uncultured Roseobacter sp. TaxID=114847 RepID=UPI00260D16D1|nr:sensor histidine kinase [uncultured Roseobacter sp.]
MALAEGSFVRDMTPPAPVGHGSPAGDAAAAGIDAPGAPGPSRGRRAWRALRSSPLTRKIIIVNLIALCVVATGILHLNAARDSLALQRAEALVSEAILIADIIETQVPNSGPATVLTIPAALGASDLRKGMEVFVYDDQAELVARIEGLRSLGPSDPGDAGATYLGDALDWVWSRLSSPMKEPAAGRPPLSERIKPLVADTLNNGTRIHNERDATGGALLTVMTPIQQGDVTVGTVAVVTAVGEIDALARMERERVLQMFVVATVVSLGLSLVLASTIAIPLADLSAAAELGRDKNARKMNPGRIRIPDLTDRPDEIGRLSAALRGMVSALYNRIDGNEQFAADVAHEIKNPLASLRSAVGTLRMVKRADQREQLLDVIDHDVRRLDRLVSDISNASRLDSELVKEEEDAFNVLKTLKELAQHLGDQARLEGIDFITDLPEDPIVVHGLEARLAQVFVNLITNAISFCDEGDAIRVWARKRDDRVIIVVEDTGPGIPEQALSQIFVRFYSQRSSENFGNHSGLGLAISKQIVEAHGGVIWAENIRPTRADITSDPLGARFVVGLPV